MHYSIYDVIDTQQWPGVNNRGEIAYEHIARAAVGGAAESVRMSFDLPYTRESEQKHMADSLRQLTK